MELTLVFSATSLYVKCRKVSEMCPTSNVMRNEKVDELLESGNVHFSLGDII